MNDNSLSPNNTPEVGNVPAPEYFPTDALSDYPDFPFTDSPSRETIESSEASALAEASASVRASVPMSEPDPSGASVPMSEPVPAGNSAPVAATEVTPEPHSEPIPETPSEPISSARSTDPQTAPPEAPRATPNQQPYTNPVADPRMPHYGNPQNPHPRSAPYTPPGQIPLHRGYGYPPGQGSPAQQGSPYDTGGYTRENTGYNGVSNGYGPTNQGYPYGNTGYTPGYNGYNGYGSVPPMQAGPSATGSPGNTPKKKSGNWMLALLIAGCILIGSVSGVLIANLTGGSDDTATPTESAPGTAAPLRPTEADRAPATQPTTSVPRETQPLATASGDQKTLNQIYAENVPAIVGISNQSGISSSTGSGFIISSDGEILTNYHVVEGASQLTVSLYDGSEFPATLVGYEAESDIALIKIEAENLPVCAIGDSDQVYVGEQIAAIGNPMGELTYTMTVGYVSAMDRFVNTDGTPISMIQVDAAINPGNSGGPVFNLYGEVIGIATAKYSGTLSGGATLEGLGFAIPINDIVEILNDLRVSGKVPDRAYMGVMVSMLPLDKETYDVDHGVFVQSVDEGGSAYKAGVQANDIILKIGDVELNAYENLQQVLRGYRAGDETTITVYRNGQTLTLPIVFDAKPDTTETTTTDPQYTEPTDPENPWETFPWDDFPWGNFGG